MDSLSKQNNALLQDCRKEPEHGGGTAVYRLSLAALGDCLEEDYMIAALAVEGIRQAALFILTWYRWTRECQVWWYRSARRAARPQT